MLKKIVAGVVVVGLLFLAWPLWSAWQLRQAIKMRNTVALEARVDWPQLRANLKPRLAQIVEDDATKSGGTIGHLKRAIGGAIAEKSVDYLVTPSTLSRLLAGREFYTRRFGGAPSPAPPAKDAKAPPAAPAPAADDPEDPDDPVPPRRLRWAFFESLGRFRIEAIHPRVPGGRIIATLGQQGLGWKLIDVAIIEGK